MEEIGYIVVLARGRSCDGEAARTVSDCPTGTLRSADTSRLLVPPAAGSRTVTTAGRRVWNATDDISSVNVDLLRHLRHHLALPKISSRPAQLTRLTVVDLGEVAVVLTFNNTDELTDL